MVSHIKITKTIHFSHTSDACKLGRSSGLPEKKFYTSRFSKNFTTACPDGLVYAAEAPSRFPPCITVKSCVEVTPWRAFKIS